MKTVKEKLFVLTGSLFLLSYLLETIVKPVVVHLPSPYAFLSPSYFSLYPFTAVIVLIRGVSLFLVPLLLLSFFRGHHFLKFILLLVLGVLSQLLSIQQIISDTTIIPLEWALSLSIAGALLVIPMVVIALQGIFIATKTKFSHANAMLNEKIEVDE